MELISSYWSAGARNVAVSQGAAFTLCSQHYTLYPMQLFFQRVQIRGGKGEWHKQVFVGKTAAYTCLDIHEAEGSPSRFSSRNLEAQQRLKGPSLSHYKGEAAWGFRGYLPLPPSRWSHALAFKCTWYTCRLRINFGSIMWRCVWWGQLNLQCV
jgi:hypothetical protein